jgi:hypothetical protein
MWRITFFTLILHETKKHDSYQEICVCVCIFRIFSWKSNKSPPYSCATVVPISTNSSAEGEFGFLRQRNSLIIESRFPTLRENFLQSSRVRAIANMRSLLIKFYFSIFLLHELLKSSVAEPEPHDFSCCRLSRNCIKIMRLRNTAYRYAIAHIELYFHDKRIIHLMPYSYSTNFSSRLYNK